MSRLSKKEKEKLIQVFKDLIKDWKGHKKFPQTILKILKLHNDKSNDYGTSDNPFANIELCERVGFPSWKGVIIRLGDKYSRLLSALSDKLLKCESIEDTFLDTAVYALIGYIEFIKGGKNNEST